MKKFLTIVLMLLVSLSAFAENKNEKPVGSLYYHSDFDRLVRVGITIVANEKFETRFIMDNGMLMLNKETRVDFIKLLKEGLHYIDIGSIANKVIELGKVESDSKFDKGYIIVKYINFADEKFITLGFRYGTNILRLISLKKEEIVDLVEVLEKAEFVSTDLLKELDKLK